MRRQRRNGHKPTTKASVRRAPLKPLLLRVRDALACIAKSYGDPGLSLSSVAKQAGFSRWHLCRMLRLTTGIGFAEQLRRTRLKTAARMLGKAALRVKEIAFAAGYKHVSSFDRDFRGRYGRTPSEFRLRAGPGRGDRV